MQNRTKLAIFDLDGTLFDTKDINFCAYNESLKDYGIDLDYKYYCEYCNGKKYTQFLPKICGFDDGRISNIHNKKKELYSKYINKARINDNLFNLIKLIKKDYYIALVTTASKKNTFELLEYYKKIDEFDLILTQDDIINPKPDPEGFLLALKKFNVESHNCIIFEDSDVGVEAASKVTLSVFITKGYN